MLGQHRTMGAAGFVGSFDPIVQYEKWKIHLKPQNVYREYKRIVAAIGCPNARFHDLRHSYSVAAIRSGDDIKTVQENLGHATAAFTLDVYGHVTEQMKKESADRMEQFIKSVKA